MSAGAAAIGKSEPAQAISRERIASLPAAERTAWTAYLDRSERQRATDHATLAAERKGMAVTPELPKESSAARSIPLTREASWYGSAEARHIADVIVSFQTPAGGWSKNLDMSGPLRVRGQSYAPDNLSKHPSPEDFDTPKDPAWNYVGTLDNDSTNTELRFLAKVSDRTPGAAGEAYRASFLKGLRYLLAAQFPNGGWPQVWPLEGGYHDAITYNDNAVTESANVLSDVADGKGDYRFVPIELRAQAAVSAKRAVACILATQVKVEDRRTIWAQQHDAVTLAPVAGRNYEPASLATGESADILIYLMQLPHPSAEVREAVEDGVAWLQHAAIREQEWVGGKGTVEGRHLAAKPGAGPIWARYYSMVTERPIFGDRDKTIHDTVSDLSPERRNGYAWYSNGPQRALDRYGKWNDSRESSASIGRAWPTNLIE